MKIAKVQQISVKPVTQATDLLRIVKQARGVLLYGQNAAAGLEEIMFASRIDASLLVVIASQTRKALLTSA